MTQNYPEQSNSQSNDKLAIVSFILGILSLVFFILAIILGFVIEDIGIVSLMSPALIVAFVAALTGLLARKKDPRSGKALAGLIMGITVLVLSFLLRIAIFFFFLPWLGA